MEESSYTELTKRPKTLQRKILNLADEMKDFLMIPFSKLDDVWWYLVNRFIRRRSYIDTKLSRTDYLSLEQQILHGAFELFCDRIEREIPSLYICLEDGKDYTEYTLWDRFKCRWFGLWKRDPVLMLEALDKMQDENFFIEGHHREYVASYVQGLGHSIGQEIKQLYVWWSTRKFRDDPDDLTGATDFYENLPETLFSGYDKFDNFRVLVRRLPDNLRKQRLEIEQITDEVRKKYDDEDREMLVRLVKVLHYIET